MNSDRDFDELARNIAENLPPLDDAQCGYLKKKLGELKDLSALLRSADVVGAPSYRVKTFLSIERACTTVLNGFGVEDYNIDLDRGFEPGTPAPILAFQVAEIVNLQRAKHSPLEDPISKARLHESLRGVCMLREAATRAREQAEEQKQAGRGGSRRRQNWQIKNFARHALLTYYDLTGKKPGTSRDDSSGERSGPAVRFLGIVLSALDWPVKPSTATDLIDECKNDPKMPWNMSVQPKFKS